MRSSAAASESEEEVSLPFRSDRRPQVFEIWNKLVFTAGKNTAKSITAVKTLVS